MTLRSISSCSVDIFLIISGYFLCKTNKRTLGKPVNLILQVSLINELAYLVKAYYGVEPPVNVRHLVSSFLPDSYYSILFVVLYIISPYINRALENLSAKAWKTLVVVLLSIFSLYNTACDMLFELLGIEIMGLNPVTAWGGFQGFNIVNFTLMYVLGAYLRYNPIVIKKIRIFYLLITSIIIITLWAEFNNLFTGHGMRSAWVYHNPMVILYTILLFLLFKDHKIESKFINTAAKSVYTCFLTHCQVVTLVSIQVFAPKSVEIMLLHYVVFSVLSYVICWGMWFLYNKMTESFYRRLDTYQINYFE